jgi:hypothetical protein
VKFRENSRKRLGAERFHPRREDVGLSYQNKAFAEKLAGHLGRAEVESYGDAAFKVVPAGQSAFAPGRAP